MKLVNGATHGVVAIMEHGLAPIILRVNDPVMLCFYEVNTPLKLPRDVDSASSFVKGVLQNA